MKNIKSIAILIGFLAMLLMWQKPVLASDLVADHSATIERETEMSTYKQGRIVKSIAMKSVLEKYQSPLVPYVSDFINSAETHGLDPYLLVSISGLESTFGRFLMPGSHNAYGWGGGYIYWPDWSTGIETVSESLRRNYFNKGAATISDVGRIYSESDTWAIRVNRFMNEFYSEQAKAERQTQTLGLTI